MTPLELIKLPLLMARTAGHPDVTIGLIDGPVAKGHPDLESQNIRELPGGGESNCVELGSAACRHGTFVAGMLLAKRGSAAPAICPDCSLLVRPIFSESAPRHGPLLSATPQELAAAIVEVTEAGIRIINLSAALGPSSSKGERDLEAALDHAAQRGVVVVAAAGNQGLVGSSVITRHPWVIPVAGCDLQGKPVGESNLGGSIGKRGLLAPAEGITSLGSKGKSVTFGGTSAAAPFVTGAVALLWAAFPSASPAELLLALGRGQRPGHATIVPSLLDAWAAFRFMVALGLCYRNGQTS